MPEPDPGAPEDRAAPREPGPEQGEAPEPHAEDGLDLARAMMRATPQSTQGAGPSRRKSTGRWARSDRRGRGAPDARGAVSGAHPDERDPQLLDVNVERLVNQQGWSTDLKVHGLFARWAELVGAEVATHTTPESFADAKLVVRTDSTAWATQLRLLAPTIVRRLNEELGHDTVKIIEVLGPQTPSWKKGLRSVRDGRGPRDTYG
jgi:predicted nucleic acid-binding Zn ribbon protein